MEDYFKFDDEGRIVDRNPNMSKPFAVDEIKVCPDCRGSLRSINRYGRLIRRAMIDEATKRFIVWSNVQYMPLALELENAKTLMAEISTDVFTREIIRGIQLDGNPHDQFRQIAKHYKKRCPKILKLRRRIFDYLKKVDVAEQPFRRVLDYVENARRRHGIQLTIDDDDSVLQTRASLLAAALLIRCDLLLLTDAMKLRGSSILFATTTKPVNFKQNREACEELVANAAKSQNLLQQAEGHLFFVQFAALERQACDMEKSNRLLEEAEAHLESLKILIESSPAQTKAISVELDVVEKMLIDGTFYDPVSNEEMRAVVQAMAREFQGTGHWVSIQDHLRKNESY